LRLVDGGELVNRFEFDDDCPVHDQIDAEAAVEPDALVSDGQRDLALNREAGGREFMRKACFVDGLQQARTERVVDSSADWMMVCVRSP
jgi:hypothetical protein